MPTIQSISIKGLQIDKIFLTTAGTCLLPFLIHALPLPQAVNLGQIWLPIFYAPLVAVLLFRPHVAIVASLFAPMINHFILGAPDMPMAALLTLELVIFSGVLVALRQKSVISLWQVIGAYALARIAGVLIFGILIGHLALEQAMIFLSESFITSVSGLIVLAAMTMIVNLRSRERGL